jgi:Uma2 family endonuclease
MNFPLTLKGNLIQKMTDEELDLFSRENKPYKFEKNPDGSLVVSEPTHSLTSQQNNEILYQLTKWNKETRLGRCFDSNAGFYLPDKSLKSPDAGWISNARYESMSASDREGFFNLCPDFIVELKSNSDAIKTLKLKMELWMRNGCRLGWLIDPDTRTVFVYEGGKQNVHQGFENPISGDPVVPGFKLILSELRIQ